MRRAERKTRAALALLIGLAGYLPAAAQDLTPTAGPVALTDPAPQVTKVYTRNTAFRLPVGIDPKDRAELAELRLMVKTGNSDWGVHETAPPTQPAFSYLVRQDGEYWFNFVTVDRQGRVSPTDLSREPPGLVVVVDTTPPDAEVQPLPVATGEIFLQCTVRDANPEYAGLKVDWLTAESEWVPLEPLADTPHVFRLPTPNVMAGRVRVTCADKAGNRTVKEIDLGGGKSTAPSVVQAGGVPPSEPPKAVAPAAAAMPFQLPAEVQPTGGVTSVTTVAAKPETLATPAGAGSITGRLLNTRRCSLEFAADPGSPEEAQVFVTRNQGRTWERLSGPLPAVSPLVFDMPGEGEFGVAVVLGKAPPPGPGDEPDCWVEVDTTRPVAQLVEARRGTGDEASVMVFTWNAADKNLGPTPVTLLYAATADGPWQPIARGLGNSGQYRWTLSPDLPREVFVRLEVADRAGNVTVCDGKGPVSLAPAGRAKVKILGVSGGGR